MFRRWLNVRMVCAALVVFPAFALAQQEGKITGTARYASGGPVAGAAILITNQDNGATRVVRTGPAGEYEAAGLAPGTYTLTSDVQGFRKVVQKGRRLDPGVTLTIDFVLELKVSEDVTVTAMKREETVFSTPVSVSAPTEEILRERGVTDLEGVSVNVPNFTVQNLGPGQNTVALRGVSSGQIARDQPGVKEQVGAYLDESVVSLSLFTPDLDLFDMSEAAPPANASTPVSEAVNEAALSGSAPRTFDAIGTGSPMKAIRPASKGRSTSQPSRSKSSEPCGSGLSGKSHAIVVEHA